MRRFWKRLRHNRKGFTLLECVLATALIGAGSAIVMSMVSVGYTYITRSRALDSISTVAQEKIIVFSGNEDVTAGLTEIDDTGVKYGYSKDLGVRVAYEVHYGTRADVITPSTFNFVAVIITDSKDNKIVYYEVSPTDERIKRLYQSK